MKILIADDDRISLKMLGKALKEIGYKVIFAEDGRKAWEAYQSEDVQLAILDWEMPVMDGITLCRKIRGMSKGNYCYIIMLTAKTAFGYLKQAFEAGADDFIRKPFNIEELGVRLKTGERIVNLEKEHAKLTDTLIESRNRLETIFDALTAEFIIIDKKFNIISVNKPFAVNHALGFREAIGSSIFDLDSHLFNDEARMAIEAVFKKGKPVFFLLRVNGPGNEISVKDVHCLPIRDESGNISQVAFIARDVTEEQKKAEAIKKLNEELNLAMEQIKTKNTLLEDALHQIRESQAQILQSEKMASIGQLAAGVAHEINNPTGFVSSNLKTLEGYMDDVLGLINQYRKLPGSLPSEISMDKNFAEAVSDILEAEERMDIEYLQKDIPELIQESREGMERIKKIVMDLKDFAHPEDEEMKFADVNACIDSTLNIVWNEIKYKAKLNRHYGEIPPLLCYPRQLNQVFMNLLVNAAQSIEDQGTIEIQTVTSNGNVQIIITDTGCGIPQDKLSKIFDPFFTTKPVGKGTGLGLHLVFGIIHKHGGTIDVESKVGEGTTFTIEIPLTNETEVATEKEALNSSV